MERRRLPPYAIEAYDHLREMAAETNDEQRAIPTDVARAALENADEPFITGDIDHVLDLLYNRGEIYRIDDQIHLTDPKEFDRQYHDDDE